jgi:nitroreductase
MNPLPLSGDMLLTTTRTVRKRLDLMKPVQRELLEECLEIAAQAPTGGNAQGWHFVVVTEPAPKRALADLYRRSKAKNDPDPAEVVPENHKMIDASAFLARHLHEVPVLMIPCIEGRLENASALVQAVTWGSILPATWSFMLAARGRGLGTAWTSLHLEYEQDAANALGIPYDDVMQVALIPVAHTVGSVFKPGRRLGISARTHWNHW